MTNEILNGKPMLLKVPCNIVEEDNVRIHPLPEGIALDVYQDGSCVAGVTLSEENTIALRDFLTKVIEDK